MTNLFLHAGAGEDAALLPQAGGDHLGHDGGVGCVFNLRGHTEHTDRESKTGSTITTTFQQTSWRGLTFLGVSLSLSSTENKSSSDEIQTRREVFTGSATAKE